ncbi:hypothetical protein ASG17_07665 [Brevundimonas sp. Leaf363]|uniref:hypothetical protein n=1 Tax=Brevundimonas sp. Leaf363 TaxID=1736353 RepID=UPI0006F9E203|nr:hypothetical protein [Brevundimonas sp. Leaf363]KQS55919.1 hypothetical protein ASG17_07665 [Brevundimonas sp. Leaf363]
MSKTDKAKKRARQRQGQHRAPSAPRVIGANDNHTNDNSAPVVIGGLTLSPDLARSFRKAEADLAATVEGPNGLIAPDLPRRREGHLAMLELELALEAQTDAKRMRSVRAEINALEKARGGELSVEKGRDQRGQEGDQWRVGRDGLDTLRTTGGITELQRSAGLRFRTDYERIDPERLLTPPTLLREGKTKSGGGEGYDTKIAESWDRLRTIHLMIAGVPLEIAERKGGDPNLRPNMPNLPAGHPAMRAIHALAEIAGKGANINEMASSGSVRTRIREDLIFALDACAIVYCLD